MEKWYVACDISVNILNNVKLFHIIRIWAPEWNCLMIFLSVKFKPKAFTGLDTTCAFFEISCLKTQWKDQIYCLSTTS